MKAIGIFALAFLVVAGAQGQPEVLRVDLPTVLKLAGARNLDLQLAREKLAEARAQHEQSILQFFPWVSPGLSYRRHDDRIQDVAGNIFDAHKQSYSVGGAIMGQWEIGDAVYRELASRQLTRAAGFALESQRQEALLVAAGNYFELARAQSAIGVAQEGVRVFEDYERQITAAVEAGIAFRGDALRVRVQAERNRLLLEQAREKMSLAATRLAVSLHLDAQTKIAAVEGELVPVTLAEPDRPLDQLVQEAERARPELKQHQAVVGAARAAKDGATLGPLIPTPGVQIFLGGLGGGTGSSWGNFGDTEDYAVSLSWRIGPGGLFDRGRIRAAESRLRQSRLVSEKIHDEIIRDVVDGQSRSRSLRAQVESAKKSMAAAEESFRLTRQRKEYAVGIVLENIQAEQDLERSRLDYLNAVAGFNQAQLAFRRALGGL